MYMTTLRKTNSEQPVNLTETPIRHQESTVPFSGFTLRNLHVLYTIIFASSHVIM